MADYTMTRWLLSSRRALQSNVCTLCTHSLYRCGFKKLAGIVSLLRNTSRLTSLSVDKRPVKQLKYICLNLKFRFFEVGFYLSIVGGPTVDGEYFHSFTLRSDRGTEAVISTF